MKKCFFSFGFVFLVMTSALSFGQDIGFRKTSFDIERIKVFNPKELNPSYKARIQNLEAPSPGGSSYRSALLRMKKKAAKLSPRREVSQKQSAPEIEAPHLLNGFPMQLVAKYPDGSGGLKDTLIFVPGGVPLDNTLAISNDDFLMCGVNSTMYIHNLKWGNEPVFDSTMKWDFDDFAAPLTTSSPFDPKLLYDPLYDRFIATYLTGRGPSNSAIILAFSTTNDPRDPWNVYKIPGNPLNNNTWTDYPAMAMTQNELFLTVNLLIPNVDWKIGFSETIIWQFDKNSGYNGDPTLTTMLWDGIELDGRNLRNLAPIQGGDSLHGPNIFFLSNRNFDLQNDSIFIVEVTSSIDDPNSEMNISVVKSNLSYGLPPNGRQENSDPQDTTDGFDTNDSRVLGSFKVGDNVQFVGNTMDFQTGNAAVYHGFISDISTNPVISARIIGHNRLDFGYPNIVFTGLEDCTDNSALIAFDHTSPTDYAGVSAVRYQDGNYSDFLTLKEGEGYVDTWLAGSYERWGDYFGIQRKYNEPGVIWTAGFYGRENNNSATWISELRDCTCFIADIDERSTSPFHACQGYLVANVSQGIEPYTYNWNSNSGSSRTYDVNLCEYKYTLEVSDAKSCSASLNGESVKILPTEDNVIYPNPAEDQVNVFFTLEKAGIVEVYIYSIEGKLVSKVSDSEQAMAGRNVLSFSTAPLSTGTYVVNIMSNDDKVFTAKLHVK